MQTDDLLAKCKQLEYEKNNLKDEIRKLGDYEDWMLPPYFVIGFLGSLVMMGWAFYMSFYFITFRNDEFLGGYIACSIATMILVAFLGGFGLHQFRHKRFSSRNQNYRLAPSLGRTLLNAIIHALVMGGMMAGMLFVYSNYIAK